MKKKASFGQKIVTIDKTDFLCVRSLSFEIIEVDGNDEAGNGLDSTNNLSDNNFIVCISLFMSLTFLLVIS